MTTAKRWSYKAGERGRNRVRAYEEKPGGFILVEFHELEADGTTRRKRVSLRHRDQERAKQQADDMAAAFGHNHPPDGGDITLGTLFDNYAGGKASRQCRASARSRPLVAPSIFLG